MVKVNVSTLKFGCVKSTKTMRDIATPYDCSLTSKINAPAFANSRPTELGVREKRLGRIRFQNPEY